MAPGSLARPLALAAVLSVGVACTRAPRMAPLPWVDPSRCLSPCSGPDPASLVAIDDQGHSSPSGRWRIASVAQRSLESLLAEAAAAGHPLRIAGAHRTHEQQLAFFLEDLEIGRFARPGHSEHELGLAVDLDYPDDDALAFLHRRAPAWGFLTSYPPGKERRTGFRPEPWHQRFVGADLAADLTSRRLTLQEFFEANPSYGRWGDCSDCSSAFARAPCRDVSARGQCDGPVLRWCMRGSLASVDCSVAGGRCDPQSLTCVGTH